MPMFLVPIGRNLYILPSIFPDSVFAVIDLVFQRDFAHVILSAAKDQRTRSISAFFPRRDPSTTDVPRHVGRGRYAALRVRCAQGFGSLRGGMTDRHPLCLSMSWSFVNTSAIIQDGLIHTLTLLPNSLEKLILMLRPSLKQRTGRDVSSAEEIQLVKCL